MLKTRMLCFRLVIFLFFSFLELEKKNLPIRPRQMAVGLILGADGSFMNEGAIENPDTSLVWRTNTLRIISLLMSLHYIHFSLNLQLFICEIISLIIQRVHTWKKSYVDSIRRH